MRFLWFGRKKAAAPQAQEHVAVETWSVNNFVVVESPLAGAAGTTIESSTIYSYLATLAQQEQRPASQALVEFLQERGFATLEISNYAHSESLGYSCKIGDTNATVLLGDPVGIARVTTPFHAEIAQAIGAGANQVLAIGGIAYAAFSIDSTTE